MKLLVAIASHGLGNDRYLRRLIHEYRSMSLEVDIVVLSNLQKPVPEGVEVLVGAPARDPWSLPFGHKQLFADRLNDYDLFIYSEDDTLITETNIRAFLDVSIALPEDEILGFLRFELAPDGTPNYPEVHGHYHWDPATVRRREQNTLAFFTCEHSACYLLTRQQLQVAIHSGGFLVEPHKGKYDLLCSAATDPYTQCGFTKLICISRIKEFLVHHLPNKYVGTKFGISGSEFDIQIQTLMAIGNNGHRPHSLFTTETKVGDGDYSTNYYEPARTELETILPASVRSVLSVGSGSGATETWLMKKGLRVAAIPIDPVIGAGLAAQGVEMIDGDFQAAQRKLSGQKFDCLLLLNVLHLVTDPVELLRSLKNLLGGPSIMVVLTPNILRIPMIWHRLRGDRRYATLCNYEESGVHVISHRIVRRWFENAGMSPKNVIDVFGPDAKNNSKWSLGLLDSLLANEFFSVAQNN